MCLKTFHVAAVAGVIGVSAACGEGADSTPGPSSSVTSTGVGGGGGSPATGTLAVQIGIALPLPVGGAEPAVGAVVALDAPGGVRMELEANADGRVTFEGIDWDAGKAAVTAYLPGYPLVSRVGIAEAEGEVRLFMPSPNAPTDLIELSGIAVNMTSTGHYLEVSSTIPGTRWWGNASGPSWSIAVVPNEPFTIVAREISYGGGPGGFDNPIYGWLTLEHPAVDSPVSIELDFANPVTPQTATGSFELPPRADSPLRADSFGFVYTSTLESSLSATVGRGTSSQRSSDGTRCDYVAEYVDLPTVSEPITFYRVVGTQYQFFADVLLQGYPANGPVDLAFVDMPRVTSAPAGNLHDAISWEAFDSNVRTVLQIWRDADLVWSVVTAIDDTTLTVPAPPSTVDTGAVIGTTSVEARLYLVQDDPATDYLDKRTGPAEPFALSP